MNVVNEIIEVSLGNVESYEEYNWNPIYEDVDQYFGRNDDKIMFWTVLYAHLSPYVHNILMPRLNVDSTYSWTYLQGNGCI